MTSPLFPDCPHRLERVRGGMAHEVAIADPTGGPSPERASTYRSIPAGGIVVGVRLRPGVLGGLVGLPADLA